MTVGDNSELLIGTLSPDGKRFIAVDTDGYFDGEVSACDFVVIVLATECVPAKAESKITVYEPVH